MKSLNKLIKKAGFVTASLAFCVGTAFAVHDLGIFELDGNIADDAQAGDDWATLHGGGGSQVAFTGIVSDPAPKTIFTQGGSKDIYDVSKWRHKDGSVPDKDDITNAYAAAYNHNGDLVVYFGADRYANEGDAQLGFWFFQSNVGPQPDGSFSGNHQVGDVLVLVNFVNGGEETEIEVLEWVGTGGDVKGGTLQTLVPKGSAKCGDTPTPLVCAITNSSPVTPPWDYTPKGGSAGDPIDNASFFEGGINITQLFEGSEVPCFASFLAETRSSSSPTAQLKDFVAGAFPVCGLSITKSCTEGDINQDENGFVYQFSGTVTNTGFGTLYDVVVDDLTAGQQFSVGNIGPGETANYNGSFESTLNPATNMAKATANTAADGTGSQVMSDSVTAECPKVVRSPMISVDKDCTTRLMNMDNKVVVAIDFSGQVCNTSDVTLKNVTVVDDGGTPNNMDDDTVIDIGTMNANTCEDYSGSYVPTSTNTQTPNEAMFSDTVTATGTAVLDFGDVEASDSATCGLCPTGL